MLLLKNTLLDRGWWLITAAATVVVAVVTRRLMFWLRLSLVTGTT